MAEPTVIPGATTHIVHSDIMDFDFEIYVQGPPIEWPEPLPVVYATDGNYGFGFAANANWMLLMGGEIPPTLTVGIGYPAGNDLELVTSRRMYDFSPNADEWQLKHLNDSPLASIEAKGGGAPLFIRFMTEELWPWIESNYNVTDDRTYVGDSMGGLFGCYTMFNHPGFFKRYIIGSPWICWNNPLVFDYEEQYAATHDDLDAIVYIAAGGAEHVMSPAFDPSATAIFDAADTEAHTRRLGELLAGRNYPNLTLKTMIWPEETHFTVPYSLIPHGLRYVFSQG
jgi:predicted alpha/beta superfamily hydrolase